MKLLLCYSPNRLNEKGSALERAVSLVSFRFARLYHGGGMRGILERLCEEVTIGNSGLFLFPLLIETYYDEHKGNVVRVTLAYRWGRLDGDVKITLEHLGLGFFTEIDREWSMCRDDAVRVRSGNEEIMAVR